MAAKTNWQTGEDVTATELNSLGTEVNNKAAGTVDAAAGTGSLRTLGSGATQAAAGDHGHAVYQYTIRQTAAAAAVAARPPVGDQPDGTVTWLLFDKPGTVDGPDDVEALDVVFNLSGVEWA